MDERIDKNNTEELGAIFAERLKKLPKVVQDAILSAEVSNHLRELAEGEKLHLDQWTTLENEVMLTLLGFQPAEDLAKNIADEVEIPTETAQKLADDIFARVFEPIREKLESDLEHHQDAHEAAGEELSPKPEAVEPKTAPGPKPAVPANPLDTSAAHSSAPQEQTPKPKPEPPKLSEHYRPGAPSHERKQVEGDPYREPLA